MAKKKKAVDADLVAEDVLLAQGDLAAMRPALAVAPELVLQSVNRARKRRQRKQAKNKAKKARKTSAKKARKSSAKKTRKTAPKKKKKTKKAARKK